MKMLLAIIIAFISITVSFGQKISIGTEFGIISSINTDYKLTDIQNRRNTYYSGLNLNYKHNDRLSFTTGLHYLRQGYRHTTCYIFEEGVKNQLVGKLDYLTIPINLNIHFLKSRKLITSFGLIGAYNVKAVQDYPKPIGGCKIYYPPDITNSIKKLSAYGLIGLGYKVLENRKIELTTNIKYYQGLTNIKRNPYSCIAWIDKYSSILMTLNFNYKF